MTTRSKRKTRQTLDLERRRLREREEIARAHERARGKCENCGKPQMLQAHHNPPKRMGGTKREYKAEDFNVLCPECHGAAHGQKVISSTPLGWG